MANENPFATLLASLFGSTPVASGQEVPVPVDGTETPENPGFFDNGTKWTPATSGNVIGNLNPSQFINLLGALAMGAPKGSWQNNIGSGVMALNQNDTAGAALNKVSNGASSEANPTEPPGQSGISPAIAQIPALLNPALAPLGNNITTPRKYLENIWGN